MDRDEILGWVRRGLDNARPAFAGGADWPQSQSEATLWALSTFAVAAGSRCNGDALVAATGIGTGERALAKRRLMEGAWGRIDGSGDRRWVQPSEVLVDFSVHDAAARTLHFTAESEMYPWHGVQPDLDGYNGYAWDFYKLLLVPSPARLFMARVGGARPAGSARQTDAERCAVLASTLKSLVRQLGDYLRSEDELGAFIFPSGSTHRRRSWVMWMEGREARIEEACPWPPEPSPRAVPETTTGLRSKP